jgi:CheY-like chemotaxis protein
LDVSPKSSSSAEDGVQINQAAIFRAPGAMESVITMLLQNINGRLDKFTSSMNSSYRILLPGISRGNLFLQRTDMSEDGEDSRKLHSFFETKKILLYVTEVEKEIGKVLADYGADVQKAEDIVNVLTSLDQTEQYDCLIINEELIEQDGQGLLMAIRRLHTALPIIVISDQTQKNHIPEIDNACYIHEENDITELVNAVVNICS